MDERFASDGTRGHRRARAGRAGRRGARARHVRRSSTSCSTTRRGSSTMCARGGVVAGFADPAVMDGPLGSEPPVRWLNGLGSPRTDWEDQPDPPAQLSPDDAVWPSTCRTSLLPAARRQADRRPRTGAASSAATSATCASSSSSTTRPCRARRALRARYGIRPVLGILIRAHQYLVARYDFDGFRIDTVKYVDPERSRPSATRCASSRSRSGRRTSSPSARSTTTRRRSPRSSAATAVRRRLRHRRRARLPAVLQAARRRQGHDGRRRHPRVSSRTARRRKPSCSARTARRGGSSSASSTTTTSTSGSSTRHAASAGDARARAALHAAGHPVPLLRHRAGAAGHGGRRRRARPERQRVHAGGALGQARRLRHHARRVPRRSRPSSRLRQRRAGALLTAGCTSARSRGNGLDFGHSSGAGGWSPSRASWSTARCSSWPTPAPQPLLGRGRPRPRPERGAAALCALAYSNLGTTGTSSVKDVPTATFHSDGRTSAGPTAAVAVTLAAAEVQILAPG